MNLISFVNQTLAILVILGQSIITLLIVSLFFRQKLQPVVNFFSRYVLLFSFIVALVATLGSLFYSEVANYEPCKLCWFQRILMYPQTILLGIALWKQEKNITTYTAVLSVIGAILAGYHYFSQIGVAPPLSCPVIGYSVACVQVFIKQFGYITIPMMSLTAFVLIVMLKVTHKIAQK